MHRLSLYTDLKNRSCQTVDAFLQDAAIIRLIVQFDTASSIPVGRRYVRTNRHKIYRPQ
jgi:hypothetical protein